MIGTVLVKDAIIGTVCLKDAMIGTVLLKDAIIGAVCLKDAMIGTVLLNRMPCKMCLSLVLGVVRLRCLTALQLLHVQMYASGQVSRQNRM